MFSTGEELALFDLKDEHDFVEKIQFVDHRPTGPVQDNTPIDIYAAGNGADLIDLRRSLLHVQFKVVKDDGTNVGPDDLVSLVNSPLQSMFSQTDVYLNQQLISANSGNHPFKSYLDILLNKTKGQKDGSLQAQGWFKDSSESMDAVSPYRDANPGLTYRYNLVANSKDAYLYGPLQTDVLQCKRWILNGVDLHLRLIPSKSEFVIMKEDTSESSGGHFKISISDIYYRMCKIRLKPEVMLGLSKTISNTTAKYPYQRVRTQAFNISKGNYAFAEDNLFQFDNPKKLIVCFVRTDAYKGSRHLNPFNFIHANLGQIGIFVNDVCVPTSQPLKLNFISGDYLEAYQSLFNDGRECDITRSDYAKGYTLIEFDLSATSNTLNANLRLEATFSQPLTENITAIVCGYFTDVFEIDHARNIIPRRI